MRVPVSGSPGAGDTEAGDAAARPSLRQRAGDHLPGGSPRSSDAPPGEPSSPPGWQ